MEGEMTISEAAAMPSGTSIQTGARLDRLPISSFHKRIFWLIGAGMFFDGYDLYVGTNVLGSTVSTHFSTLGQNAQFVSLTFVGMTIARLQPVFSATPSAGASLIRSTFSSSASPRSPRHLRRLWIGSLRRGLSWASVSAPKSSSAIRH